MTLDDLREKCDKLQLKYGDKNLNSIYSEGCISNPDFFFVFMNPTGSNISAKKEWTGIRAPWLGTKNIWDLFYETGLFNEKIYKKIKSIKGKDWTEDFCKQVYKEVENNKCYITNLGKCTQVDARALPDSVYKKYLKLLEKEIEIINPKVIVLFGNQVSSIVLDKKISVSQVRKMEFTKKIGKKEYRFYSIYYPVGNGRYNIDKSIEDINWIKDNIIKSAVIN